MNNIRLSQLSYYDLIDNPVFIRTDAGKVQKVWIEQNDDSWHFSSFISQTDSDVFSFIRNVQMTDSNFKGLWTLSDERMDYVSFLESLTDGNAELRASFNRQMQASELYCCNQDEIDELYDNEWEIIQNLVFRNANPNPDIAVYAYSLNTYTGRISLAEFNKERTELNDGYLVINRDDLEDAGILGSDESFREKALKEAEAYVRHYNDYATCQVFDFMYQILNDDGTLEDAECDLTALGHELEESGIKPFIEDGKILTVQEIKTYRIIENEDQF